MNSVLKKISIHEFFHKKITKSCKKVIYYSYLITVCINICFTISILLNMHDFNMDISTYNLDVFS